MPERLDEERVDEIIEAFEQEGTLKGAADVAGCSPNTVKKYAIERGLLEDDSADEGEELADGDFAQGQKPPGFTAAPPSTTPLGSEPTQHGGDERPDFSRMGYDDFIQWFFEHSGFGVKEDFARNLAQQCSLRGELPDEAALSYMIQSHNSGVGNSNDANMIAENYWAAAKQFLNARGAQSQSPQGPRGDWVSDPAGQPGGGNGQMGQPQGDWRSSQSGRQQGGQQQPETGGWVSEQQSQQSGYGQQRPGAPPGGQGGYQQPGQPQQPGQSGTDPAVIEALNTMQETQRELMEKVAEDGNGNEDKSPFEQMQEFAQMQQVMQEAFGSDDSDDNDELEQVLATMKQNFEVLQRRMAEDDDEAPQIQIEDGNGMGALATLAAQGDMDPESLTHFAEAMGVTDPEVKKAEFELKKEEVRSENRKELIDNVFDNMGDVMEQGAGGLVESLLGNSDNAGEPEPAEPAPGADARQQPAAPAERQEPAPQHEEPAADGAAVDDDSEPEQTPGARSRHADAIEGGQDADDFTLEEADEETEEADISDGEDEIVVAENDEAENDEPDEPGVPADENRCIATNRDGSRCKQEKEPGSDYCKHPSHTPDDAEDEEAEAEKVPAGAVPDDGGEQA